MWLINSMPSSMKALLCFTCVLIITSIMIWLLNPVIIPVLVSLVLYVCLLPLHDWLTNLGWRRDLSALAILLLIMFMLLVPGSLLLGAFNEQAILWQSKASTAGQSLNQLLEVISNQLAQWQFHMEVEQLKANILSSFTSGEGGLLSSLSNVIMSVSSSLLLVPFITFFLLRDFESLRNKMLDALPNKHYELGWLIYFKVANQTQGYVRAVLIQQSILALVASIGFWIAGFESPVILGLIAGVLGLIPYVGPALGLIPPFYLVLANQPVNYDAMYAAVLVIGMAYLIDNLLVIPLIVARFANLHPLVALLSIIIFGNFFGILGMMAAIPSLAIANIVYSQFLLSFNPKKFHALIA
ncbi:MAG: AI-2E family transporter [Bermanella sp.]